MTSPLLVCRGMIGCSGPKYFFDAFVPPPVENNMDPVVFIVGDEEKALAWVSAGMLADFCMAPPVIVAARTSTDAVAFPACVDAAIPGPSDPHHETLRERASA